MLSALGQFTHRERVAEVATDENVTPLATARHLK